MSGSREMVPIGGDPVEVHNWGAREQASTISRRSLTAAPGSSMSQLSQSSNYIRLGNGEYFGGTILNRAKGTARRLPVIIAGNIAGSIISSRLIVNNSDVMISGVTFDARGVGAPIIQVMGKGTLILENCIVRASKDDFQKRPVTMDTTSQMAVVGCTFADVSSQDAIEFKGSLGNLTITSSRLLGPSGVGASKGWALRYTGQGNIVGAF